LTYKNLIMSFPRFYGSPIMKITEEAKKHMEEDGEYNRYFVIGPKATWEVNPSKSKVDYLEDYAEDPVEAAGKYECKPSAALNAYFSNQLAVKAAFTEDPMPVKISEYELIDGRFWRPVYEFHPDFKAIRGASYAMHGDLAHTGDSAGIAMAHVAKYTDINSITVDGDGKENTFHEARPEIKVDFVIAYNANKGVSPPREIQIRWARQLAVELMKRGFKIERFTFDKFESLDSIQILTEEYGVEAKRVSADTSLLPYKTLRDLMNERRVTVPKSKQVVDELLALNLDEAKGKIDHPEHIGKDMADALACAAMGAIELGGQEDEDQEVSYYGDEVFEGGGIDDEESLPFWFSKDKLNWNSSIGRDNGQWR
jgi:hypothetical protein